jgi:predicted amidohydrolase
MTRGGQSVSEPFTVSCVQNCASEDREATVADAVARVREAAQRAQLVCLPEFFSCLTLKNRQLFADPHSEDAHPVLKSFRELAAALDVWLLLGSLAVDVGGAVRNRSFLLNDEGEVVARYDKVHLFDVNLKNGERYRESDSFSAGGAAVTAATPWGTLGLSVCYDLRFPHLYRELAKSGADFLTIPAAFTRTTGRAHWHVLIRARAIENGSYVFAPAQCGRHGEGETFGHSLIVDPWGEVLADAGDQPGIIYAKVDSARVAEVRGMIPALRHDRPFESAEESSGIPAARRSAARR